MRRALLSLVLLVFLVLLAGCATTAPDFGPGALRADVLPFKPSRVAFVTTMGETRQLNFAPQPDGTSALMTVAGDGISHARTLTIRRHGESLYFASGPQTGTELLRLGVQPGTAWQSGPEEVQFVGWERVEVPAGVFDAARITTRRGTKELPRVDSWWFAPDVGLVRFRTDQAGLLVEEMVRLDAPISRPSDGEE